MFDFKIMFQEKCKSHDGTIEVEWEIVTEDFGTKRELGLLINGANLFLSVTGGSILNLIFIRPLIIKIIDGAKLPASMITFNRQKSDLLRGLIVCKTDEKARYLQSELSYILTKFLNDLYCAYKDERVSVYDPRGARSVIRYILKQSNQPLKF